MGFERQSHPSHCQARRVEELRSVLDSDVQPIASPAHYQSTVTKHPINIFVEEPAALRPKHMYG